MELKTRRWFGGKISGETRPTHFHQFGPYSDFGPQSLESRASENHVRLNGRWSGGGNFSLFRDTKEYIPSELSYSGLNTRGLIRIEHVAGSWTDLPMYPQPNDLQAAALGATAIARTLPTNPAFDLSVNLGEIRADGIPNLPGTDVMEKTKAARAAGGEYLNVQFGWLPLVSAIRDFAKTVENSDSIIRQYQEDANHVIKRSYHWPLVKDEKRLDTAFSMSPAIGFFEGGQRIQTVEQRQWFEADYIYYLPTGGSTNDKIRRYGSYARKLLGVRMTPEVLWNLAPWSWAADWFGNIGDVMTNISNIGTDGLVMQNAYLMSHSVRKTVDFGHFDGDKYQRSTHLEESKLRWASTPYGFGVIFGSLSATQIAIISALGLSRW